MISTNTKDLKNGSCFKKAKISYEAVSNRKFDTDDVQISFQTFDLILQSFILFLQDFNKSIARKEDLKVLVLKSKEKIMKNVLWW